MQELQHYTVAFWGLFSIVAVLLLQWMIATGSKATQPGAIPGKIDDNLSHASFVFRSNRTFMNSLENFPAMLGTSLLAILAGADAFWTGLLIWAYSVARIVHMLLYYRIATEKNPSPRSYFFITGLIANIALLGVVAAALAR